MEGRRWLVVGMLALAVGCAFHRGPRRVPSAVPMRGGVQEGVSSWYGKDFNGRPTASGEIYDMYGLSAAHRTLALGTTVRVTNLDNGRNVNLKINDRGPFVGGRILDCSYGAAKALGFVNEGLANVRIEVVSPGQERRHYIPSPGEEVYGGPGLPGPALDGSFTVQVGAFLSKDNALRYRDRMAGEFGDAYVIRFRDFYRVRVGHLDSEAEADALSRRLQDAGIESFVTRND